MAAPPLDPAAIRYYRRELKGFLPVDELMTIVLSRKITRRVRCLLAQAGSRRTWTRGGNVGDIARSLGSIMTSRPVAFQTYSKAPRRRGYTPQRRVDDHHTEVAPVLEQCSALGTNFGTMYGRNVAWPIPVSATINPESALSRIAGRSLADRKGRTFRRPEYQAHGRVSGATQVASGTRYTRLWTLYNLSLIHISEPTRPY